MDDRETSTFFGGTRNDRVIPRKPLRAKSHRLSDGNSFLMVNAHQREQAQAYEVIPDSTRNDSQKRSRRANPLTLTQWSSELISCLVMLGMLAAILGILLPNDGKPLPQWPFHISINTVIAVLTTVLKACALLILAEGISQLKWEWFAEDRLLHDLVLFDQASRGPWGCLRLICSGRGGHLIASLGALLVILTLAVDPFTQQIIRYYDCERISTKSQASLPRSLYYDEAATHTSAGIWPPATAVLGFIDQGIYNPSTLQTPFDCASGNCTFSQPFSTLGFCATCEDMSAQISIRPVTVDTIVFNVTANKTQSVPSRWINTTLPSGSYAAVGSTGSDETWFALSSKSGWIEIIQAAHVYSVNSSNWEEQHFYADTFRSQLTGCVTAYQNSTWACHGPGGAGAARCKFNPCVRTYAANVHGGKLEQTLIDTQDMFVAASSSSLDLWIAADLKCAGGAVTKRLADVGFHVDNDTIIIPWNVMVNTTDGTASIWLPKKSSLNGNVTVPGPLLNTTGLPLDIIPAKCIYSMQYWGYSSINSYLYKYLSGVLGPGPNGVSVDGPSQIRSLYNDTYASFNSINNTFQSVAEAITLRMRQYQSPYALPIAEAVHGEVIEHNTCIRVRWAYFAFPTAIVFLTIVFLVSMILATSHSATGAVAAKWKSSPLPMMFQGLKVISPAYGHENVTVPELERSDSMLGTMKGISKRMTARLNLDDKYFT